MAQQKIISVTIPAFKDRYLKEAIDSVLAQTYQDYELVIVNDASPYDIDTIVEQYTDSHIRYYKNEYNCGGKNVVDNWNICLRYAKGEYVLCMGDDDKLTPSCLQDFSNLIEKYPQLDIYHSRSEIIDEDSNLVRILEERPEWESVYSLMYNPRNTHLGDWLFRTDTLIRNGGFYKLPYGWQSDDISAFIAAAKHGVANTKDVGFQYRGNALSISHDLTCIEDKIDAVRYSIQWRLNFISDKHPDNEDDRRLISLIKSTTLKEGNLNIDNMVEFDIRKQFWKRSWFWLLNRRRHGISFIRYIRCVLKTIKYSLMG